MKITKDNFVWLLVTEKAKEIWSSGLFSLFILYEDDSESLIEEYEDLNLANERGNNIGIEVGHLKLVADEKN